MTSPTQRTVAHLKAQGAYPVAIVERWNPYARVRQDLFGMVDVLAILNGKTVAVQTTSASNMAARVRKLTESPALPALRAAAWRIEVHGWRKAANGRWTLRIVDCS